MKYFSAFKFDVQYHSAFGHSAFSHSVLGPYLALGPIRCSVIRCTVIRRPVFRRSVIRCSVIRCSVFRRSDFRRSVFRRSVFRRSVFPRFEKNNFGSTTLYSIKESHISDTLFPRIITPNCSGSILFYTSKTYLHLICGGHHTQQLRVTKQKVKLLTKTRSRIPTVRTLSIRT
jgi:hypothetical protein